MDAKKILKALAIVIVPGALPAYAVYQIVKFIRRKYVRSTRSASSR